jgi:intracellular septation protein
MSNQTNTTGEKPHDSRLKLALEYGPLLLFMLGYWVLKDKSLTLGGQTYSGFIVATGVFVVIFVASILGLWRLTGKIAAMQIITLVVVVFMGGLTLWFNDAHFIKMKPTIIYVFFAAALGVGLVQGKSYLRLVMGDAIPMQAEGWMILTRRIALFFVALAVANEVVWRNFSDGTWVAFKAVGLTVAMFGFLLTQAKLLERYGIQKDDAPKP